MSSPRRRSLAPLSRKRERGARREGFLAFHKATGNTVHGFAAILALLLILTACGPTSSATATPEVTPATATPRPSPTVIVPTAPRIIVTLTPRPTETLIPTATQPYDVLGLIGDWVLTVRVVVLGDPHINKVQFTGTGRLSTRLDTRISGNISFTVLAFDQPPCRVIIPESRTYDAGLSGALRLGEDGRVYADLTVFPAEPDRPTSFDVYCTSGAPERYEANFLWATLNAVYGLQLTLPFEPGYTDVSLVDLTGPGRGLLYGSAQLETTLNR